MFRFHTGFGSGLGAGIVAVNRAILLTTLVFAILGCAARTPIKSSAQHASPIARGVKFLVGSQQPDGSWGTGTVTRGNEIYSMVPGSHDAYRVATTALCVMALGEAGETHAHAKGVEYLITQGDARRDSGDLLYNIWAHTFALQALSVEMQRVKDHSRLKPAAQKQLGRLIQYAVYTGGWNYYDFNEKTASPAMGATSFGTAAGLVALHEARKAGLDVPQLLIDRSVRRLEACRLPTGVFTHGFDYRYMPRTPANQEKGAVGRTQPSNYALWLWNAPRTGRTQALQGLELFFKYHDFLEMGRKRPFPHESWYQTSGYYYYFDHYYVALLLEKLPPEDREKFRLQLADVVLPHQEEDGSWWDYPMWDYDKPYGTAFAVMTLLRCGRLGG